MVDDPESSDVNIIVTCIVKFPTERKMIRRIKCLLGYDKPLLVAGCMPKAERTLVESIAPQASLLGPNSILKIVDVVNATLRGTKTVFLKDLRQPKICSARIRRNPVIDIVPIAEGCAWQKCAYCIVSLARGKLFSYPIDLIVEEIEQSLKEGCKEFWLTGQDVACYGLDIGTRLPALLKKITDIEGEFFVRIGMMNPAYVLDILEDLVEVYKDQRFFKFLHLPVQSGDNEVLRLMNRPYSVEDFKKTVSSFRRKMPRMTIATDVICGFPGESERAFERSMKLVEEVKPDVLNISRFFPRPGTPAEEMPQLPGWKVKERSRKMTELFRKRISIERNRTWLDWEGEIIIDEEGRDGSWVGRNFAYKPTVVRRGEDLLGELLKVRIKDVHSTYLEAEIF